MLDAVEEEDNEISLTCGSPGLRARPSPDKVLSDQRVGVHLGVKGVSCEGGNGGLRWGE